MIGRHKFPVGRNVEVPSFHFYQGPSTRLLNSIRRMYSPRVYSRHDVYRPEIPYTAIRPNYPCTVRSPLVSANMTWRQPLPQRPVLLQPQSVPNGSIPNNPEMYNGGHGSGVSVKMYIVTKLVFALQLT